MEQEQQRTFRGITLFLTIEQRSATERDYGASLLPYHWEKWAAVEMAKRHSDKFEQTETEG